MSIPGPVEPQRAMKGHEASSKKREAAGPLIWGGFFLLILWIRFQTAWVLVAAALVICWAGLRSRGSWRNGTTVILLAAGVGIGLRADAMDRRLADNWDGYWEERREQVAGQVGMEFDALVTRGDAAVMRVAQAASLDQPRPVLQDTLESVLDDKGLTATAVVGLDGKLIAWEGSHHGRLPTSVLEGPNRYTYAGTPLFSYLYFTTELPGERG